MANAGDGKDSIVEGPIEEFSILDIIFTSIKLGLVVAILYGMYWALLGR